MENSIESEFLSICDEDAGVATMKRKRRSLSRIIICVVRQSLVPVGKGGLLISSLP
jgi:hypothetical protein